MKFSPLFFGCLLFVVLSITFFPVYAATTYPADFPGKDLKFSKVIDILNTFVTWIFTVFLIVAVIFIIVAAFRYLFSGGDPTKIKAATQAVIFAAVAIAVALLSISIRFVVQQIVGSPQF